MFVELIAMLLELAAQIVAAVQAHITDQPDVPIERARLRRALRRWSRPQKCEAESCAGFCRYVRAIGAAKCQRLSHSLEQTCIRRGAIERNNAGEAAHEISGLCSGNAASNVA